MMDRKLIYGIVLAIFAISCAAVFQAQTIANADYSMLLNGGMKIEDARAAGFALFIILPLVVYAIAAYLLKADEFHALAASVLFAIANADALFSLHPIVALLLGKQYAFFDALKMAGAILPLGAIAVLAYAKDKMHASLALAGLALLPFAPAISFILLALAAAKAIGIMENEPYGDRALVFAVFVFAFQGAYAGDLVQAAVVSAFIAVLAYVAVSLHNIQGEDVYALLFLFIAFATVSMLYSVNLAASNAVSQNEIAAFSFARQADGEYGIFDYTDAFAYYSGKEAAVLDANALLKKDATLPGFAVFSARSLDNAYANRPVIFAYSGVSKTQQGDYAVFANARYVLYMRLSGNELSVEDVTLMDSKTGEGASLPFTKIKQLFNASYKEKYNRMVNVQEIGESGLYKILFGSDAVFEQNGTRIAKVR